MGSGAAAIGGWCRRSTPAATTPELGRKTSAANARASACCRSPTTPDPRAAWESVTPYRSRYAAIVRARPSHRARLSVSTGTAPSSRSHGARATTARSTSRAARSSINRSRALSASAISPVTVCDAAGISPLTNRAWPPRPASRLARVHRSTRSWSTDARSTAPTSALPGLAERAEVGAVDLASVLHERVDRWTRASLEAGRGGQARLVSGLIPAASHTVTGEMADALRARERLMEERAALLVERAVVARAPWLRELGAVPVDTDRRARWEGRARTIAAYRDRYGVTDSQAALGSGVVGDRQQAEARAFAAEVLRPSSGVVAAGVDRRHQPPIAAAPDPILERQSAVGR